MPSALDTTELLAAMRSGDGRALDAVVSRVYEELRRIAHRALARRRPGETLQTTGLVHEVYLKLVGQAKVEAQDRAHFLALAATAMRRIVIDYARRRRALKRGGGWRRVSLDRQIPISDEQLGDLIELDAALERLKSFDPRLYAVVECRYFGGMTVPETAMALDLAPRTVDRVWQKAKAWLYREMHEA